jgi:hypothetical protein
MSAWAVARSLGIAIVVSSAVLVGCVVDDGQGEGGGSYGGSSGYSGSSGSSSGGSTGTTSGQPMLVDVDPNRTMTANPGQGVGVFTEYQTGGHWNVWWTCDTSVSNEPCSYDVTLSVSTGTLANVAGQGLERSDTLTQASSQQIELLTTTTTATDGVTFDTVVPSGTTPIITVDAKLDGQESGTLFYFVQDGEIDGNYGGSLTDPLMLEPSSP